MMKRGFGEVFNHLVLRFCSEVSALNEIVAGLISGLFRVELFSSLAEVFDI
jgi:hypothetical protein